MTQIHTRRLDCGAVLIVEQIAGVRSAGLTWLVPAGSAREPDDRPGLSALWAEILCRGAGELDSRTQADAFDRLGVSRGTRVETFNLAVSATMLGARLKDALPLITDMVRQPTMADGQVEASREMCLHALAGIDDDPQERVMIALRNRHAAPPINRSSLGEAEGLRAITADEARTHWTNQAVPNGSIIALAGDVQPDLAADELNQQLDGWTGAATDISWNDNDAPRGYEHETDETNQVHIAIAHDAPPEPHDDSWRERVVTAVLSGGMSGRLFTEVREKRSLCYSVYASYGADAKYGRTIAYSGTTPERAQETADVLIAELRRINTPDGPIDEGEFNRAKIGLKSRLVMSGESSSARAGALARDYARIGEARSLDELTAKLDAVTLKDVNDYLTRRSLGRMSAVTIGPAELSIDL